MDHFRDLVANPELCSGIPDGEESPFFFSRFNWVKEWDTRAGKLIKSNHWVLDDNEGGTWRIPASEKAEREPEIYEHLHHPEWGIPVHDRHPAPMLTEIMKALKEPEAEIVIRFNTDGTATVSYHRVGQDKIYVQVAERLEDAALNIWFLVNNNNNEKEEKNEETF